MKYGFVIDNRKCIGCHACTVACKSEHDVPIGVNRTWVKQTEKGTFPDSRRLFSVLRCNHCTDAPCVEICPVEALYVRDDGIVDFNNDRCIGCKSCMQACPYDALYIDPESHTAAKCNYCAHRVDVGLEPACVNVCPEHAIISGDMENPETEIAQLLAREQVTVRKGEKDTKPNVFYIDGDESSLNPSETDRSQDYMWNSQSAGVGHYSKFAEKLKEGKSLADMVVELSASEATFGGPGGAEASERLAQKSVAVLMENGGAAKRVYDTPDKGILWGWEVSAYLVTKAISAGLALIPFLFYALGWTQIDKNGVLTSVIASLGFLTLTGALLVKDLDRPDRFLYVLLRPQWKSWLVRGGYIIAVFGMVQALLAVAIWLEWEIVPVLFGLSALISTGVATYTAFLFAQAKGRDFWQSPTLPFHMLIHAVMAGTAFILVAQGAGLLTAFGNGSLRLVLILAVVFNMLIISMELLITHPTKDARLTAEMIWKGRYRRLFWLGVIAVGNLGSLILLALNGVIPMAIAGLLILAGIYFTEKIWVEAPQRISLT